MKRILLVLLALLFAASVAVAEEPKLKVTGSTGGTVYHDDAAVGVLDVDQDVKLVYSIVSLALNAGYTFDMGAPAHKFTFGYTLSAAYPLGPFAFAGSIASNALTAPVGGAFSGDILGDIKASATYTKAPFGAALVSLFYGGAAGPFFKGVDLSGTYTPKWGAFTLGAAFTDAAAAAIGAMVADVEGLSFYAKAKVSY